jgi:hypothetical protein
VVIAGSFVGGGPTLPTAADTRNHRQDVACTFAQR